MTVFSPAPKPAPRVKAPRVPKRRKPLAKKNAKRAARLFVEDFGSKEFVEMIHALPCAVCEVYGWTEAAHLKSRGAGGKAENNIVPLCGSRLGIKGCHQLYDDHSEHVRQRYLKLKAYARRLWQEWQSNRNTTTNEEK